MNNYELFWRLSNGNEIAKSEVFSDADFAIMRANQLFQQYGEMLEFCYIVDENGDEIWDLYA